MTYVDGKLKTAAPPAGDRAPERTGDATRARLARLASQATPGGGHRRRWRRPLVAALGRDAGRWRDRRAASTSTPLHRARQPHVMAFWHGRILPGHRCLPRPRHRRSSPARTSTASGSRASSRASAYGTARGSTSRGGVRALRAADARRWRRADPTAFTVDGPRGPGAAGAARRRLAGAGAPAAPILPFHIEARAHWTLRSWDRTQMPKPFARVTVCIGAPLVVPRGLDDAAIERGRAGSSSARARARASSARDATMARR